MPSVCTDLEEPLVNFDTLRKVRLIEQQILPLEPILISFDVLVKELQEANMQCSIGTEAHEESRLTIHAAMQQFKLEAMSYRNQALYINSKARITAQSIMDSLNLGFQRLAQRQDENTLILATSAREDSIAIRAITLVTSFYLPFSFVAVRLLLKHVSCCNIGS